MTHDLGYEISTNDVSLAITALKKLHMFISVIKMLLLQIVNVWSLISHTGIRLPVGWHIKKYKTLYSR